MHKFLPCITYLLSAKPLKIRWKSHTPTADALDKEVLNVVNECLELVKAHVAQQRWKSHLTEKESAIPAGKPEV